MNKEQTSTSLDNSKSLGRATTRNGRGSGEILQYLSASLPFCALCDKSARVRCDANSAGRGENA